MVNGDCYEGEMVAGQMSGIGKYQWANLDVYRGTFLQNKRHGKGRHKYAVKGCVFEGSYVDDLRSGYGVYTYKNGDRYEGSWENDVFEGRGVLLGSDGTKFEGDFKDGKLMWENQTTEEQDQ